MNLDVVAKTLVLRYSVPVSYLITFLSHNLKKIL